MQIFCDTMGRYFYPKRMLLVATVQMGASDDRTENLAKMHSFAQRAKAGGAQLVVFPELAYLLAPSRVWKTTLDDYQALLKTFCAWAKELSIDIVPGTLREPAGGDRVYNTLPYINAQGEVVASYRKIFLFRAKLPDREYDEAKYCEAGSTAVVVERPWGKVGLAICFDLRFPELFRVLSGKGAQMILLPSAFTVPTGQAHWEVLVRARAIENQCFVLAPAQTGACGDNRITYGHSLVVSPWGEILSMQGETEGLSLCPIDFKIIEDSKNRVAAMDCRRDSLFFERGKT